MPFHRLLGISATRSSHMLACSTSKRYILWVNCGVFSATIEPENTSFIVGAKKRQFYAKDIFAKRRSLYL
jgi:hypothetical protein